MRRMSEATLIAAVRREEATAFDSLHRAHAEKLVRTVQRITRNHQDAEDAAQDSFEHSHTARQLGVSLTVAKARVFHAKTALRKSRVLRHINGRSSGAQACRIAQTAARQTRPDC